MFEKKQMIKKINLSSIKKISNRNKLYRIIQLVNGQRKNKQ